MNRSAAVSALRHFAHEECASCPRPGVCIMLRSGACLLARGQRCGYFEDSVLPIAQRRLRLSRNPNPFKVMRDGKVTDLPGAKPIDDSRVVAACRVVHPEVRGTLIPESDDDGIAKRQCPDCGGPLGPRMRFCETCRRNRRRESARRLKAEKRGVVSAVNGERTPKTPVFSAKTSPENPPRSQETLFSITPG